MTRLFLALLVFISATASVRAQSLADLARKEEQRRKDNPKPAKVYTNKDLGQVEPSPAPAAGAQASDTQGGTPAVPAGPGDEAAAADGGGQVAEGARPAEGAPEPTDEQKRADDETRWRGRMEQARSQLERSRMYAEALQTRANSLWADFTARDDPMQRAKIEADRKKTLAEIDKVKLEIEAQTKAVADIEEEARRAGVPPGWLR